MKVYVAYFVYKGVLEAVEVHTDPVAAQTRADEWRKEANPEEMAVDVLVEPVRGPVVLTASDLPVVVNPGESITILHTKVVPAILPDSGTPLRELHLTFMYENRLNRGGYKTVEKLCQTTERQLYFSRNIGAKCIAEVKEALAKKGLSLLEP